MTHDDLMYELVQDVLWICDDDAWLTLNGSSITDELSYFIHEFVCHQLAGIQLQRKMAVLILVEVRNLIELVVGYKHWPKSQQK